MPERNHLAVKHVVLATQIALNAAVGYLFLKVLAGRFGATAQKDVFDIAYSIPFVIMNVGGLAFAHSVVTAHFSTVLITRPHKVQSLFAATLGVLIVGVCALSALCVLFVEPICRQLAPGMSPELREEMQQLILLLLPIVLTFSVCTLFSAILNAYGAPVSSELGPLVARVLVIGGLLTGMVAGALPQVALALTMSSVAGLAVLWIVFVRTTGLRMRLSFDYRDAGFRNMARQAGGFFAAAVVAQISVTYMRRLASLDEVGTNASLTYALSLLAPVGLLVGKPLSLVTGPHFARTLASGRPGQARAILDRTVAGCLTVGVLAAGVVSVFATPLVHLLYGGGEFDERATLLTAELLSALVWSLPGSVVLWAVLMPLVAVSRSHRPALIYVGGYVLQIAFMALLFPLWGRLALAWGYTLAASFQALAGYFVVYRALQTPEAEAPLELAC